tara:strand:+ start:157 stop:471 length:315 start_codon:yes stop_codon:yes gene_type:complete
MRYLTMAFVAALLLFLPGCESLADTVTSVADRLYEGGHITESEHTAMTGGIWGTVIDRAITVGGSFLLSVIGIQKLRGTSATVEEREARVAAKKAKKPDLITGR